MQDSDSMSVSLFSLSFGDDFKQSTCYDAYFDKSTGIGQTHVIIIGVGNYPHLDDGSGEMIPDFDLAKDLKQLTSPALSAELIYQTTVELHKKKQWVRPLGSIELLLSPTPDQTVLPGIDYSPATYKNIEDSSGGGTSAAIHQLTTLHSFTFAVMAWKQQNIIY